MENGASEEKLLCVGDLSYVVAARKVKCTGLTNMKTSAYVISLVRSLLHCDTPYMSSL